METNTKSVDSGQGPKITAENQHNYQKEVSEGIEAAKAMLKEPPTEQQVIEWFKTDLHAAVYSLTALISMPQVVEEIAKRFYQEVQKPRTMPVKETENQINNGRTKHQ